MNEHFLTDQTKMISFQFTLKSFTYDKLYAFDYHVKYTFHLHIQFFFFCSMHIILSRSSDGSIHFGVNDDEKRNEKHLQIILKPKYIYSDENS